MEPDDNSMLAPSDVPYCEDDSLMAMVGKRLAAAHEAGELDATVPFEAAAVLESLHSEEEGEMIGSYKLLREIGVGGFGSVWMAEQSQPISRRVALKVIKMGMDTREVIARFEQERQALAMMDHPNIAKVFDAGATDRGRPFFVMELVKGIPITEYCDQAGLGITERLVLFGDVCAAINHAHQKGIIHRDIKPSNVMVSVHGDKPVVKVIDFGIAKATQGKLTEKTLFTGFGQFMGTPVYMSPEQASMSGLDIDTRSDIYALGILLYEMLVGKPPFDAKSLLSAGYEEMRRIIREVEPAKPSSRLGTLAGEERTLLAKAHRIDETKLNKLVEPDLDWIVMKAIDKDRTRRYETANAFAQDIVRFLSEEVVTARPPSKSYQLQKFARRNKAAFRVAAVISVLLVAATAVSSWLAVRATRAERRAVETLKEVAAERDAKDKARKEAEAVSTYMSEVFQSPDPNRDGRTITVAETLDTAVKKLESDLSDQPETRVKLQATLGNTYIALGLYQQAIPLLEKVRNYHHATRGSDHPDTLMAMHTLASCYHDSGRNNEALMIFQEVLPLFRKVKGPEHPDTLRVMTGLAACVGVAGRKDESLSMQEELLVLRRKVSGQEDPYTLWAMQNLANSYSDAGRRDEALKLRVEVLALSRKVNGPERPATLAAMDSLANSYLNTGRNDEALTICEDVLALRRKILGPEHPVTLDAMNNLAVSYAHAGRRDDASKMFGEVLALRSKVLGPEHPATLGALNNLANAYSGLGRKDEALKIFEEVLALRLKVLGPEHLETLGTMNNVAAYYHEAGRKDEALGIREKLLVLRRKVLGSEHPDTFDALNNLAVSYSHAGRSDEAIKMFGEVLAFRRKVLGLAHPATLETMNNLGICYTEAKRTDEAAKLWKEIEALKAKR